MSQRSKDKAAGNADKTAGNADKTAGKAAGDGAQEPRATSRVERRSFSRAALGLVGWGSLSGSVIGGLGGVGRFFFPRVRYEPPTSFTVGRAEDYVVDTVDSRWLKKRNLFVIRKPAGIYAMSAACTHLGCSVRWFQLEGRFKCPCHGSFFDIEGDVLGGPAPVPLYRASVSRDLDGAIRVDVAQTANKPEMRTKAPYLLKV